MPRLAILLLAVSLLAACGRSEDSRATEETPVSGGSSTAATLTTSEDDAPSGGSPLSYLALGDQALIRVETDSGDSAPLIDYSALDAPNPEQLRLRLGDGVLWVSTGPGRIARVDPDSGELIGVTEYRSTQSVIDFGLRGGLLWVLVGEPFVDAVLLGVDRISGQLVFNLEPPPGGELGALAIGDDAVWLIGGDPDSDQTIARIDPGSGRLSGTFDVDVIPNLLVAGAGFVWVTAPAGDAAGSTLQQIDPISGAVLGSLSLPLEAQTLAATADAVWVGGLASTAGPAGSADRVGSGAASSIATVVRVESASLTVSDIFEVGRSGGGPDLVAGADRVLIVNHEQSRIYIIDALARALRGTSQGPPYPLLVLE